MRFDWERKGECHIRVWKHWLLRCLPVLLLATAACENQPEISPEGPSPPTAAASADTRETAVRPEPTPDPRDSGSGDAASPSRASPGPEVNLQRSFAESVSELSICQKNPPEPNVEGVGASDCIVAFGAAPHSFMPSAPMPDQPHTYALHMEDVYFFITFITNDEAEMKRLASLVRVEGGVWNLGKEHPDRDGARFKGEITGIQDQAVLNFGNLPPVTLIRSNRYLSYTPQLSQSISLQNTEYLALEGREHGRHVLVSDQVKEVVLHFDQPIRTSHVTVSYNDPEKHQPSGEWIDEQQLLLQLPDGRNEWNVTLGNVFSESGDYLAEWAEYLKIRRIPDREWMLYPTGEKLADTPYMKFYDFLLRSPDRTKWLGLVELGGPMGDEGGAYYSVLLEQPGKAPKVISDILHMRSRLKHMPLLWIGSDAVAFSNFEGIWLYDIPTGDTTKLADQAEMNGYLNSMAYDAWTEQLIILVMRFDSETEIGIDRWIFPVNGRGKPQVRKAVTNTIWADKYSPLSLPILPQQEGIFQTSVENGTAITRFEARDGSVFSTEGIAAAANGECVYLYMPGARVGEPGYGELPAWHMWKPGGSKVPIPLPDGWIYPFGHLLLAQQEDHWLQFDPAGRRWVPFPLPDSGAYVPEQSMEAIYRTP